MERLTAERVNGIKTGYWSAAKKDELVQRLGEYEDTGLEPEEIQKMRQRSKHTDNGWISVAEMPPKRRGLYLCTAECEGERYVIVGHYNGPGWTEDYAGQKVIAWQQLPEPYGPEAN